jgi:hypothetical protein
LTVNLTTQYYLTTSAGTGGSINPSSGWYNAGSSVPVSATPNSGFQFSSFSGSLSGSTTPQNLVVTGPESVTAGFTASPTTFITEYIPLGGGVTAVEHTSH